MRGYVFLFVSDFVLCIIGLTALANKCGWPSSTSVLCDAILTFKELISDTAYMLGSAKSNYQL